MPTLDDANFPDLRVALEQWVSDAIEFLVAKDDARSGYMEPPRWRRDEDGFFRRKNLVTQAWNHAYWERLRELPSWAAVHQAFRGDERLGRQIDTSVGTILRRSRLDEFSASYSVIPQPDELDRLDPIFGERYRELDSFLASNVLEYTVVWPIPGIVLSDAPVRLESLLQLDNMTDSELGIALDTGTVHLFGWDFPMVDPQPYFRACLRYNCQLSKIVGEPDPNELVEQARAIEGRLDDFKTALEESLALVLPDSVMTAGRFMFGHSPTILGSFVNYQHATIPGPRRWRSIDLEHTAAGMLDRVWQTVRKPDLLGRHKGLALALRRISYQAQRERPEDELLDLMIAAEALYLSDLRNESYRGELRFRLSLRAALWADLTETNYSRREVFKLFQAAYDARSAIAHGGSPKQSMLKVRDQQVQLAELVREVRSILVAGCRSALSTAATGSGWPADWDGMTFAPEGPVPDGSQTA